MAIGYNTSCYDFLSSLKPMEGVVDIYKPNFKSWRSDKSRHHLKAEDYPEIARAITKEMLRQVGALETDANGLATHGVLLRHLEMPGRLEEARALLDWAATGLSDGTYVNLMDQYLPVGNIGNDRNPELNRPLTSTKWMEDVEIAVSSGLRLDRRAGMLT